MKKIVTISDNMQDILFDQLLKKYNFIGKRYAKYSRIQYFLNSNTLVIGKRNYHNDCVVKNTTPIFIPHMETAISVYSYRKIKDETAISVFSYLEIKDETDRKFLNEFYQHATRQIDYRSLL